MQQLFRLIALYAGAGLIALGTGLIYLPAGLIATGVLLIFGVWLSLKGEGGDDT